MLTGLVLAMAAPAHAAAATVTVNSTGNAGDAAAGDGVCATGGLNSAGQPACTLRAAIQEANASAAVDTVHFALPASEAGHHAGVWTISPASALPSVTAAVTIDGYTQAGAAPNTRVVGNDAVLTVVLDGTSAGGASGLTLAGGASTVRGLVIGAFSQQGILATSGGNTIAGNWVGIGADGVTHRGNGSDGIRIMSASNTVGGGAPADRNVASGNGGDGIRLTSLSATHTTVMGNHIGTDAGGTVAVPNAEGLALHQSANTVVGGTAPGQGNVISGNTGAGVRFRAAGSQHGVILGNIIGLDATAAHAVPNGTGIWVDDDVQDNVIGGTAAGAGNVIAGNSGAGVVMYGSSGVQPRSTAVLGNAIRDNGGIGIDLSGLTTGGDGVSPNDPGDADAGANTRLNFPELSLSHQSGGTVTVAYGLDVPAGDYRIEFFANTAADPSGHGEGATPVHAEAVTHPGGGSRSFTASFAAPAGAFITATATRDLGGGSWGPTSEFSAAMAVDAPPVAAADTASTPEDAAVGIDVLANDSDPDGDALRVEAVTGGDIGTAAVAPDGTVTYTPLPDRNGTDTLTYTVADGPGETATGHVTVTVAPVDDPPAPVDDDAATVGRRPVTAAVLANDTDPDGDALAVTAATAARGGDAEVTRSGRVRFTPAAGFHGVARVRYEVSDGTATATGRLTVRVSAPATCAALLAEGAGPRWLFLWGCGERSTGCPAGRYRVRVRGEWRCLSGRPGRTDPAVTG